MIQEIPSSAPSAVHYSLEEAPSQTSPVLASILQDLELCTSSLIASIPDGIKTIPMVKQLNEGALINYNRETQSLTHQGISFKVLKGSNKAISQGPVVSIGSEAIGREIISLDPQNSPLLESWYQELLSYLKEEFEKDVKPSIELTLECVSTFVREEIFCSKLSTEKGVDEFVRRWQRARGRIKEDFTPAKNNRLIPVIPIDDFIRQRTGVCRHESLVTAYILDRLSKEENMIPKGTCYHVRDVVEVGDIEGGHAWNLFVSDDQTEAWHIDSLWGLVKNFNSPEDVEYLQESYGESAISREQERLLSVP